MRTRFIHGLLPGLVVFCFALTILAAAPALGGVVFQVETTYHSGSVSGRGPQDSRMSVEGKNLKMEIHAAEGEDRQPGDQKDEAIFRGDRREMVVVDHRERSYMVIDAAFAERMGGQVKGQMAQAMEELEKHLETLDPKQREMAEKMLKGQMGQMGGMPGAPAIEPPVFERTGERASKQGYPCVRYDVLRGGEKIQELWVTDWGNVKGGREVEGAFREMADFWAELLESFGDMMGGGLFAQGQNPIESFTEIDGFPVVTRSFEGGELESETVLRSVTERDLDPDAFEPPKGYRLRTMGPQ